MLYQKLSARSIQPPYAVGFLLSSASTGQSLHASLSQRRQTLSACSSSVKIAVTSFAAICARDSCSSLESDDNALFNTVRREERIDCSLTKRQIRSP